MVEENESVIERVDKIYQEFEVWYKHPNFQNFDKRDALIMYLVRRIAALQMYCEQIVKNTNPIIDWAKYWDIKLKEYESRFDKND